MAATTTFEPPHKTSVFRLLEAFEAALATYEQETMSKFVASMKEKAFGQKIIKFSPQQKIYWELKHVPYDGIPFSLHGAKTYICHQGPDKNIRHKERYHARKKQQALDDHACIARPHHTKKRDCPAHVTAYQVVRFPAFKITDKSKSKRRQMSAALKKAIQTDASKVEAVVEYHTRFPDTREHQYHPTSGEAAGRCEPIDPRVRDKIVQLALSGVSKAADIRQHLATYVAEELFRGEQPPPKTRRRFNPTQQDIWNIMARVKARTRGSNNDQADTQSTCSELPQSTCSDLPQSICSDLPQSTCDDLPQSTCSNLPQSTCSDLPQSACDDLPHLPQSTCSNLPQCTCSDPPQRTRQRISKLHTECASLIQELADRISCLQDEEKLETLIGQLTNILEDMKKHIRNEKTRPNPKIRTPKKRKSDMVDLPVKAVPHKQMKDQCAEILERRM